MNTKQFDFGHVTGAGNKRVKNWRRFSNRNG